MRYPAVLIAGLALSVTIAFAQQSSGGLYKVVRTAKGPTTMKDLTFLTRDGCVNTPDMVFNLDDALKALGWPTDYQFINIGKLRANDVRTGYPTPTLLWKGKDIFGMPVSTPPFDVPS